MKKGQKCFEYICRKWWLWIIIALLIIGMFTGRAIDNTPSPSNPSYASTDNKLSDATTGESQETTHEEVSEYAVVDKFIALFTVATDNTFADLSTMDIHGDDYKVEFRLPAFEIAVGKKGTTKVGAVEVVNYGIRKNDAIRVYATIQSREDAVSFVKAVINIFDDRITNDEITENLDRSSSIVLGPGGYITGYVSKTNSGEYDVMIDCSKLLFMN